MFPVTISLQQVHKVHNTHIRRVMVVRASDSTKKSRVLYA